MPRLALSAGSLCAALAFTLACGGAMTDVNKGDLAELAVRVDKLPSSAEKSETMAIIEEAYVQVHSGDLGLIAVSGLEIDVEDAIADGAITPMELAGLKTQTFMSTPSSLDPKAREAVVMQLHEEMALARERLAAELSGWSNEDLRSKAVAAGWSVDFCDMAKDEWADQNWCSFVNGDDGAWVYVAHYKSAEQAGYAAEADDSGTVLRTGNTVVNLSVTRGAPSMALRDALLPKGEKIDDLDRAKLDERAKAAGWAASGWYAEGDAEMAYTAFEVSKAGLHGEVNLFDWSDRSSGDTRTVVGGAAYIEQGMDNVEVSVYDQAAAEALLTALNGA